MKSPKRSRKSRSVKRRVSRRKSRSVRRRRSRTSRYSKKSCPRGSISRKSYTRKSGIKVHAACVKSKSLRAKGQKPKVYLPKLKEGSLIKYGYAVHDPTTTRHKALKKIYKAYGLSTSVKKLNAVRVLTKNTAPQNSAIYARDIRYMESLAR